MLRYACLVVQQTHTSGEKNGRHIPINTSFAVRTCVRNVFSLFQTCCCVQTMQIIKGQKHFDVFLSVLQDYLNKSYFQHMVCFWIRDFQINMFSNHFKLNVSKFILLTTATQKYYDYSLVQCISPCILLLIVVYSRGTGIQEGMEIQESSIQPDQDSSFCRTSVQDRQQSETAL